MRHLRATSLAAATAIVVAATAFGQQTNMDPRARCEQLLVYWDEHAGRRGEGATTDMERKTAAIDCDNRRYADGIKRMENLLRNNRFTVPPPG